jgi:transcription antitermination factor NusG
MLDIQPGDARIHLPPDARAPPIGSHASWPSYARIPEITIKVGRGGFRANALGGLRSPPGGRPRKVIQSLAPVDVFRWYVVRAMAGQTDRADEEIRAAGFEVVTAKLCIPATRQRRSASGSLIRAREERFVPLFARYIIVKLNLAVWDWKQILESDAVERIISGGHLANGGIGIPIAVRDSAIELLRKVLRDSRPNVSDAGSLPEDVWYPPGYRPPRDDEDPFGAGTRLHLTDGLLTDHAGVCAMSDGQRVMMLMSWFNRDGTVPTSVAQSLVEKLPAV